MIDLSTLVIGIWLGCFVVVAFDSALRHLSPVFWRFAGLADGPFGLLAYGIARQMAAKKS